MAVLRFAGSPIRGRIERSTKSFAMANPVISLADFVEAKTNLRRFFHEAAEKTNAQHPPSRVEGLRLL